MMELIGAVQNYHWGKKGKSSLVGRFASANSGIILDESKPFAEFWMGTHPNGPSIIKGTKTELSQYLTLNPHKVISKATYHVGNQLPFLFKILSVEEPLSIQAHPTKSHAEELFKNFPEIYRDGNHKPELAIAASKFEALCSFRPLAEIKHFLKSIPEFRMLLNSDKVKKLLYCDENLEESASLMRDCFQSLMLCEEEVVVAALEELMHRFETFSTSEQEEYLVPLVRRIYNYFPKDVGVFCVYWMNYIVLSPGEALYLAPNEPHAYLKGDCIECMANSDNVIRAALTPKFRDIQTLCQMLSYKNYHPSEILFQPHSEDDFCQLYAPPINDFAVAKITLPINRKYNLKKRDSASILLVIEGQGKLNSLHLEFGKVFFISSGKECCIDSNGLVLFQVFSNIGEH